MMCEKIEIGISEKPIECVNGDDAFYLKEGSDYFISLFDGAGHGSSAHKIAIKSREILTDNQLEELPKAMRYLHESLRGTNGGVAIIGKLNVHSLLFRYVGIGNIFMCKAGKSIERFMLQQGIIGYQIRTPVESSVQLVPGDTLILYSDGIKSNFDLDEYSSFYKDNAQTIAQNIIQRFAKPCDDATCLVIRVK